MKRCEKGFSLVESIISLSLWLLCMFIVVSLLFVFNNKTKMEKEIDAYYVLKRSIMKLHSLEPQHFIEQTDTHTYSIYVSSKEVCVDQEDIEPICLTLIQR
ncbi:hypothetical protein GCM10008967_40320 [Bacillus carboniphilus]|uniref:Type II secretion system protein n=1 Tax=Bacillus carboniphilus TaxID=86663 RepID=A0ABN0WSW3_9BACI